MKENKSLDNLLKKIKLPVKYWIPTLISVIIGTAALIAFLFSIINPIENDIIRLQNNSYTNAPPSILKTTILLNTKGDKLSDKQKVSIKNIEFMLNNRDDLILLIIGYSDDNLYTEQSKKIEQSQMNTLNVYDTFVADGIKKERIFHKGYGQDVPKSYPKQNANNIALIVVDLYYFMELSVRGNILSVI